MAKQSTRRTRPTYRCEECGWQTAKWVGRCGECQTWGSVAEAAPGPATPAPDPAVVQSTAVPIGEVEGSQAHFRSSGVPELDRVLGGGLVPGATLLLAGEPGVGKSTLLLEVAAQTARYQRRTLYLAGEESAAQVRLRADRTGGVHDELYLAAETDLGAVLSHIEQVRPAVVVVDSIQTIGTGDADGVPGGVAGVKEVAAALTRVAKSHHITMIMVGHVTKDGSIAGPRVLEHLVDVVLGFEGDRHAGLRMVRASKNRFGPVDEVGCFDLSPGGITAVADPTGLFVESHERSVPGTCVGVTLEGRRPLLAEVQGLVAPTQAERPRRTTSGLDSSRLAMVMAVLQQHARVRVLDRDVFASTVGGVRLQEPAVDLTVAAALASSQLGVPTSWGSVAIGEIGLAGELRTVRDLPQRVAEASRLGFSLAVVPGREGRRYHTDEGMLVTEITDVAGALRLLGLGQPTGG